MGRTINTSTRFLLSNKCKSLGGQLQSIIAKSAIIGKKDLVLEPGLNIMHNVLLTTALSIGEGTLINANTNIHHDCKIGSYCEVGPSCTITGGVTIGNFCSIGAGCVILPGVVVGNNIKIGAGTIVNKNILDEGATYVGVPAKKLKKPLEK